MYLATVSFEVSLGVDLRDLLGLHLVGSEKFAPYQIVTYMFMHGDFSHIFFNMFAVWMFGNAIENYLEAYERMGLLARLRQKWFEDQSWISRLP